MSSESKPVTQNVWKLIPEYFWKVFALLIVAMWYFGAFGIKESITEVGRESRTVHPAPATTGLHSADFVNRHDEFVTHSPYFFKYKNQKRPATVHFKNKPVPVTGYY